MCCLCIAHCRPEIFVRQALFSRAVCASDGKPCVQRSMLLCKPGKVIYPLFPRMARRSDYPNELTDPLGWWPWVTRPCSDESSRCLLGPVMTLWSSWYKKSLIPHVSLKDGADREKCNGSLSSMFTISWKDKSGNFLFLYLFGENVECSCLFLQEIS